MTSRHTLVGAITGLLYSAGWFAFQMYRLVLQGSCFANYTYLDVYTPPGPIIIIELPTAIFSLLVVIKFGWKLFKCLRKKKFTKSLYEEGNKKMCRYCDVIYVKHLLKKNHTNAEILNKTMPLYRKLFNHMTKPVPGFKFPIAMLITASVSCVFVYYITAYLALYMDTWFKPFTEYYDLITAANAIATILTFLCGMRNIYLVLINYRRDMRRLYRGDRTFIPSSLKKASPKTYMAQGMRFVGNSIVGSLWGSVFAYMVLFVPLALMMCVLRELSKAGMIHHLLNRLQWLIYPVCTIIIFKVQIVLVGKFFMQPKLDPGDKHRPLAIDNRIVYDVFTFFLVFLNASIGIIQFVKRVLLSVILGAFLIPRMDRSLLMRGYETMDKCNLNCFEIALNYDVHQ
ncbi:uncharacterized protein LOC127842703 isoform X2 [Dreissena polymorpha]|uniref:uncharacterized protein LOC127842703 isoform X2 n=1 Tax=Dreissena polymorpha TaxID=45954 RepID=UPI0022641391|nr:uncharacterized protein LOC127842703 isoform X2 [Dreissena polymorpha]